MTVIVHEARVFVGENALGNPAGVVLMDQRKGTNLHPDVRAVVARTVGHPETAFVIPKTMGGQGWNIRYYSRSGQKVPFCGHATLAAAATLRTQGVTDEVLCFDTGDKLVEVRNDGERLVLEREVVPDNELPVTDAMRDMVEALGFHRDIPMRLTPERDLLLSTGVSKRVVELPPPLMHITAIGLNGLALVAVKNHDPERFPGAEWLVRYFAPGFGIDEDLATGSIALSAAEWMLPPHNTVRIFQASPGYGGALEVSHTGDKVQVRGVVAVQSLRPVYA